MTKIPLSEIIKEFLYFASLACEVDEHHDCPLWF